MRSEMTFVEALLSSVGAALILTQGSLFRFLQERADFFRCSLCMGFWCGTAGGATGYWMGELSVAEVVCLPCSTSLVASLAGHLAVALYRIGSEPLPPWHNADARPDPGDTAW